MSVSAEAFALAAASDAAREGAGRVARIALDRDQGACERFVAGRGGDEVGEGGPVGELRRGERGGGGVGRVLREEGGEESKAEGGGRADHADFGPKGMSIGTRRR